jgi:hypothetical protein
MPRSSIAPTHPDSRPERPAPGPGGVMLADSNPSPFRWRHLVGWLRKG